MKRIVFILIIVTLVCASLLTFPGYLSWMVLAWIGFGLAANFMNKPAWPWLFACSAILLSKRPGFTLELCCLILTLVAVGTFDLKFDRRQTLDRKQHFSKFAVLLLAAAAFFASTRWFAGNTSEQKVADARPIACLGDSLTAAGYQNLRQKSLSFVASNISQLAGFSLNQIVVGSRISN